MKKIMVFFGLITNNLFSGSQYDEIMKHDVINSSPKKMNWKKIIPVVLILGGIVGIIIAYLRGAFSGKPSDASGLKNRSRIASEEPPASGDNSKVVGDKRSPDGGGPAAAHSDSVASESAERSVVDGSSKDSSINGGGDRNDAVASVSGASPINAAMDGKPAAAANPSGDSKSGVRSTNISIPASSDPAKPISSKPAASDDANNFQAKIEQLNIEAKITTLEKLSDTYIKNTQANYQTFLKINKNLFEFYNLFIVAYDNQSIGIADNNSLTAESLENKIKNQIQKNEKFENFVKKIFDISIKEILKRDKKVDKNNWISLLSSNTNNKETINSMFNNLIFAVNELNELNELNKLGKLL
jgi:hypothetical protein